MYNKNCYELLPKFPDKSVDLAIIDPPYEHEYHGGGQASRAKDYTVVKENTDFMNAGFDYNLVFSELVRICKIPNIICFCSNKQIVKLMGWFEDHNLNPTLTTWRKSNACPLGNGKYISDLEFAIFARGKKSPWNYNAPSSVKYKCKTYPFVCGKKKLHPAEKPLNLIKEYVELHSLEGNTVLDCFMGSGTTALACKDLNRNFIGVELEKKYFDIAKDRVINWKGQEK
jgi:DNA modification methylase